MIREANNEDITILVEWMLQLISHFQHTSSDPYVTQIVDNQDEGILAWFNEAIPSESSKIFLAEEDDMPVGFIFGKITKPFLSASKINEIGLIELCWVDPAYRQQGVASQLVHILEDWFKAQGIEYIDLQYLVGNVSAEKSWEKMGYMPYRISSRKKLN